MEANAIQYGYITIFILIGIIPFFIGYFMNLSRIRKIQNISNQLKKDFFLEQT